MSSSASSPPIASREPQHAWLAAWYGKRRWTLWLLPLLWLFIALSALRRAWWRRYPNKPLVVPVVVVGNITVGGTGKTPLLIALVRYFQARGYRPGVISRGYGGKAIYPYVVHGNSSAAEAGDEPLAIYRATGADVCVGPDRLAAARLLENNGCDLLLSDDGLQHYPLPRDIEIAVVDGERGLGNGYRLPVGPLREAPARLTEVDWVVVNSPAVQFSLPLAAPLFTIPMAIKAANIASVQSDELQPLAPWQGRRVHAVAGIGNPQRFYNSLAALGIEVIPHSFPDHHHYTAADFAFAANESVIMTEKDAVKCREFAKPNWYYLPIHAELPEVFWQALETKLGKIIAQKKARFG